MLNLTYELNKQDLENYYKATLKSDLTVYKFRWRLRLIVPAAILLVSIFAAKSWQWWVAAVVMCIVWILVAELFIYRSYFKKTVNKLMESSKFNPQELHVKVTEKNVVIDGRTRKAADYVVIPDQCLVVLFGDKTNLIIPDRVMSDSQNIECQKLLEAQCDPK